MTEENLGSFIIPCKISIDYGSVLLRGPFEFDVSAC